MPCSELQSADQRADRGWNSSDLPPPRDSPSRRGSSSTARTRRDAPAGWPARADPASHTTPHACRAVSGTVADSVCRSAPESLRSTAPDRKADDSGAPPPPNAASVKPLLNLGLVPRMSGTGRDYGDAIVGGPILIGAIQVRFPVAGPAHPGTPLI